MNKQTSLFGAITVTTQSPTKTPPPKTGSSIKSHSRISSLDQIYERLVSGLERYAGKNHFKRAVLGLSGGVDSSLTLKIAVDALGPENITVLLLPELGLTKQENIDHAKILCQFFGVKYFYQPINNFLTDFSITPWQPSDNATMNTKARIRAVLLYSFANTENALVLGTSNKSETLLGYGTKFGDLAADIEVIGDLYKTEVIALADFIGLPPEITNKTPTAELAPGQTDEGEMGATYKDMDKVLIKMAAGYDEKTCIEHGLPMKLAQLVFRRVKENKHKSEPPVVLNAH